MYLAEGARLHFDRELKIADLASIRVRLREPLLQTRLVHEAHGARAVAWLHERLAIRRVANAAQNGRIEPFITKKKDIYGFLVKNLDLNSNLYNLKKRIKKAS